MLYHIFHDSSKRPITPKQPTGSNGALGAQLRIRSSAAHLPPHHLLTLFCHDKKNIHARHEHYIDIYIYICGTTVAQRNDGPNGSQKE